MSADASAAAHLDQGSILRAASALGMVGTGGKSVTELVAVLCSETTSSETILSLIEQQPLLAARILRVANSAYYGYTRAVTTLQRAMAVLGTQAVRGIAVTCSVDRVMSQRLEVVLPDAAQYLRHSIATAIAAQALALDARLSCHQEAYVGGMLHNIGVAIQACIDGTGVRKIATIRAFDTTTPIRELEAVQSRVAHEVCGGVALSAWRLPSRIVSAAAHHHGPADAPADDMPFVALVSVAASLATACNCGFNLEEAGGEIHPELLRCAGLETEHVDNVGAVLEGRVACLLDALN